VLHSTDRQTDIMNPVLTDEHRTHEQCMRVDRRCLLLLVPRHRLIRRVLYTIHTIIPSQHTLAQIKLAEISSTHLCLNHIVSMESNLI